MTPTDPTADSTDMAWALDQLLLERGVRHAVLFTADGMLLARSRNLPRDDAERAAAAFAGIRSLQLELAGFCGEDPAGLVPRHVISDLKTATALLFAAGARTGVAVSVQGESTGAEVQVAIRATLKMISGLRPLLEARERAPRTAVRGVS